MFFCSGRKPNRIGFMSNLFRFLFQWRNKNETGSGNALHIHVMGASFKPGQKERSAISSKVVGFVITAPQAQFLGLSNVHLIHSPVVGGNPRSCDSAQANETVGDKMHNPRLLFSGCCCCDWLAG